MLLLGLPVLIHIVIEIMTILDQKSDVLDGYDCSDVRRDSALSHRGHVSRLMNAPLSRTYNDSVCNADNINRSHVIYYRVREEETPFPDTSRLNPIDSEQQEECFDELNDDIVESANENCLSNDQNASFLDFVHEHTGIFPSIYHHAHLPNYFLWKWTFSQMQSWSASECAIIPPIRRNCYREFSQISSTVAWYILIIHRRGNLPLSWFAKAAMKSSDSPLNFILSIISRIDRSSQCQISNNKCTSSPALDATKLSNKVIDNENSRSTNSRNLHSHLSHRMEYTPPPLFCTV